MRSLMNEKEVSSKSTSSGPSLGRSNGASRSPQTHGGNSFEPVPEIMLLSASLDSR